MIENELTKKLREELDKQAGKNPFYKKIADFIYHAVTAGNHIDVMNDITCGKYTVEGAFEAAQEVAEENNAENARCVVLDDPDVYGIAAEYFGLKDCISGEEIKAYCVAELTGEPVGNTPEKSPETTKNSVSLDLGLDSLFD